MYLCSNLRSYLSYVPTSEKLKTGEVCIINSVYSGGGTMVWQPWCHLQNILSLLYKLILFWAIQKLECMINNCINVVFSALWKPKNALPRIFCSPKFFLESWNLHGLHQNIFEYPLNIIILLQKVPQIVGAERELL